MNIILAADQCSSSFKQLRPAILHSKLASESVYFHLGRSRMIQLYISRLTCQQLPGRGGGPPLGKVHSFLANHSQHAVGKSSLASALSEIRCKKLFRY